MPTDQARLEAAAALRELIHTFAAHDGHDDEMHALAVAARVHANALGASAKRDRMALMRARVAEGGFPAGPGESGFADRAVDTRYMQARMAEMTAAKTSSAS